MFYILSGTHYTSAALLFPGVRAVIFRQHGHTGTAATDK